MSKHPVLKIGGESNVKPVKFFRIEHVDGIHRLRNRHKIKKPHFSVRLEVAGARFELTTFGL